MIVENDDGSVHVRFDSPRVRSLRGSLWFSMKGRILSEAE